MRRVFDWLLWLTRFRSSYLIAVAVSLSIGFAASEVFRLNMEDDFRQHFQDQAWFTATNLEAETMNGLAMGTAALLGLNELLLKEVAIGKRPPDDPECLSRLRAARLLLGADGIHVVDSQGIVVAHETTHKRLTGTSVGFRPYWQQAMRGNKIAYPAVGSDLQTPERGLYIAAPIRGATTPASELIGAVVVEIVAGYLDHRLGLGGYHALLLSPQGVVFASTDMDWLFRTAGQPSAEALEEIKRLRQFGSVFADSGAPRVLAFDLGGEIVKFAGKRYAKATAPVRWNDPAGDWLLVMLGDLKPEVSQNARWTVGLLATLMVLAVMELIRRAIHYEAERREAVERAESVAEELAAVARHKAQLSEMTLSLQRARDLSSLADVFFRQLAVLMPVHQGSLYFVDYAADEGDATVRRAVLRLADGFATTEVPETISIGEGLLGQCALERRALDLSDVPPGFWRVSSGLGESTPGALMVFPILNNEVLLGVLEIASLEGDFSRRKSVIESLLPVLGMNMEILLAERGEKGEARPLFEPVRELGGA
ncbi:GAF domain-containing protein [Propionivibrio limicola]|uniref:GAF domain-containing protein n=1 Tax=Propionivibrio limicola TaxID=167645 RepID=UPI001478AE0A|nr:GAF domain-containing protein [Propionivibrio limicola]